MLTIDFLSQTLNMDNWSAFICTKCIKKLRVSYEFDKMCKKSSIVLKQYLTELFSCTNNNSTEKFVNSDLRIQIGRIPHPPIKRRYINREKRCSLLKDLLTKIKNDKKLFETRPFMRLRGPQMTKTFRNRCLEGGLKSLLHFTKSYNYGYKLENGKIENVKFDCTPLDKLTDFVNNYFKISLSRFHERITCVLEETEEWFEEREELDEMVKPCKDDLAFEEVIVEPDINIKKEIIMEDMDDENAEFEVSYPCSSSHFQVKLEKVQIKVEPEESTIMEDDFRSSQFLQIQSQCSSSSDTKNIMSLNSRSNAEIYPTLCETLGRQSQSSLNLLQEYTENKFTNHNKPAYTVLERTKRGRFPFINPQLKKQFLHQDFKCSICNRRFKSQGYLQSHCSKMKHKLKQ
ncbi:zinc-finger associated domain containing protein [Oryctes borbonicus]|uniref:Zinc-finger associated domain containing protein n=1 Tax=Oryctes borbonicus TaxID=1629725 RepID=A0A0T6ATT2_9SCAR|nr:zinc-finger associated domain containing protein [Oryctes borbonicus]